MFEFFFKYKEHKTLQTYKLWRDTHSIELLHVEQYMDTRADLFSTIRQARKNFGGKYWCIGGEVLKIGVIWQNMGLSVFF